MEFNISDKVFIKVALFKHMIRFKRNGKLALRYISLYEITEQVGKVAYRFALPVNMNHIPNVFHVLSLYKYIGEPAHVLRTNEIQLLEDLNYDERLVQILNKRIK